VLYVNNTSKAAVNGSIKMSKLSKVAIGKKGVSYHNQFKQTDILAHKQHLSQNIVKQRPIPTRAVVKEWHVPTL